MKKSSTVSQPANNGMDFPAEEYRARLQRMGRRSTVVISIQAGQVKTYASTNVAFGDLRLGYGWDTTFEFRIGYSMRLFNHA